MGAVQGRDFPYEAKETISTYEGKTLWKLQTGARKSDKAPVSIFSFDCKKNASKVAVANNNLKRLKTLRHPNILAFMDGLEIEGSAINIVTEEVVPLSDMLQDIKQNSNSISWGLYQVAVKGTLLFE